MATIPHPLLLLACLACISSVPHSIEAGERAGNSGAYAKSAREKTQAASRAPGRWGRRASEVASDNIESGEKTAQPSPETASPDPQSTQPIASQNDRMPETDNPAQPLPATEPSDPAACHPDDDASTLPTPEGVERYRAKLEERLLERYNNLPEFAGRVAKVAVVLSKPLDLSIDGKLIRAEFDQLVYDSWGNRVPALEKEYYVVTFGTGGVQQVRSDPSIRVGLDLEKSYSEHAPPVADPFRNVEDNEAFSPAPKAKMPDWWRPEFPELD